MSKEDRSVLGWGAFAVAIAALFVGLFALRDDGASAGSESAGEGAGAAVTVVEVTLAEWSITPAMIEVPSGPAVLRVTNAGLMVHNLSLPSLGIKTADLAPGETADLDLGTPADGNYDLLCDIPGHSASGMTAMLTVGGSGGGGDTTGGGGAGAAPARMDWQEMDRMMEEVALEFPAKTEGHGGDLLEPTMIDSDGTKVFDIVAEEIKWEVSPGKVVDAMAYNGVVPAPEIHLEVGDRIRINFTNKMLESTDIHFHGIRVPNAMDGVDPYTQPVVVPGGTFVYEFEALEPAVGIYHSHHNAQEQIPNGLFGAFTIGEMPIPEYLKDKGYTKVDKKVNMVLNDAGTIGLSLNGKSFPATEPYTLRVGEVMQVTYMNEGLTSHPMHMHQPLGWIIAKDGVPLPSPIPGDTFNVAPGERYTVLYKGTDVGVWAWHCHILTHAESPEGMFGMVTAVIVEA
ncbi:MAG: multicopper oxidase domain-containing protein [Actinomycetota bacterium]|nr:MAG: putative multicopper oxidase [Acidimicrobiaceae bacterium]